MSWMEALDQEVLLAQSRSSLPVGVVVLGVEHLGDDLAS